ncbi:MAG: DUF3617 domain-containing protein [Desulfovibrionaceae bacterium]|jgi:hypothetical protein|nr:DUF3617 domain-containing protein [Desulfovibrionaceae bacterium]
MKTALIALCAALAAGAVHAEGAGDQKPGLWETRLLKMTVDGQDVLPQMQAARRQMRQSMANMPPEQRKQMEAAMGPQSDDPSVDRICVSAEMAKNQKAAMPQRPRGADCAEPKVNRSGDRTTFEVTCKQGASTIVSKGESVVNGDQITTKAETVTTEAGAKHVMAIESQMKFIGSDCGGVKPLDQIARDMQAGAAARPAAPRKK